MRRYGPAWLFLPALCLGSIPSAVAQTSPYGLSPFESSYLEPPSDASRAGSSLQLTFRLALEVPLPGPLLEGGRPRLLAQSVEIPVAAGTALTGWTDGSQARLVPRIESSDPAPASSRPSDWVETEDGKKRFSLLSSGVLLAQKRCRRCRAGWKKNWILSVAGNGLAPPLVTGSRVFYGGLDNRVYGVKRRNGHRVWAADVEGRVSRPLRLWSAGVGGASKELVLVTPDHGREILALDSGTGSKVAGFALPENGGMLVGAPLVAPDGKVLAVRKKYNESEASLMVFELLEPPAAVPSPTVSRESGL